MKLLQYLPYVLLFALATMLVYGWGLWRSQRQGRDLMSMLYAKGVSRVRKALRKRGPLTRGELREVVQGLSAAQPFSKEHMGVTDPSKFLDSLLPYMIEQRLIAEQQEGKILRYALRR